MNLSHDGTIITTNIVLQNLERLMTSKNKGLKQQANELKTEMGQLYLKQNLLCNTVRRTIEQLEGQIEGQM